MCWMFPRLPTKSGVDQICSDGATVCVCQWFRQLFKRLPTKLHQYCIGNNEPVEPMLQLSEPLADVHIAIAQKPTKYCVYLAQTKLPSNFTKIFIPASRQETQLIG